MAISKNTRNHLDKHVHDKKNKIMEETKKGIKKTIQDLSDEIKELTKKKQVA